MSRDVIKGTAISSLVVFISLYLPLIGFFAALFLPLPILFYRVRLGFREGGMIAGLTALVVLILLGNSPLSSLFFIELLIIGFVMGELLTRGFSLEGIFTITTATAVGFAWLLLAVISAPSGSGIHAFLLSHVVRSLELTLDIYENLGIAPETLQQLAGSLDKAGQVLLAILPGMAAAAILYIVWLNFLTARPLLASRQVIFPIFGQLRRWKAPDHLVWGVIAGGVMVMLLNYPHNIPAVNALLVFLTIYFFQGIAIVAFFFDKKQIPRFARIFLYSLIALQQMFLLLVIALGFFDLWLDFRKLKTRTIDD